MNQDLIRATSAKFGRVTVVEILRNMVIVQDGAGQLQFTRLDTLVFDAPVSLLDWVRSEDWVNGIPFETFTNRKAA